MSSTPPLEPPDDNPSLPKREESLSPFQLNDYSWLDPTNCHAIRIGTSISVSGTTVGGRVSILMNKCAYSEAVAILNVIDETLKPLGASLADIKNIRVTVRHADNRLGAARAIREVFTQLGKMPASSIRLGEIFDGPFLVEMEAEAVVGSSELGMETATINSCGTRLTEDNRYQYWNYWDWDARTVFGWPKDTENE